MQLQFREKFISIEEFDPVELHEFTVLTGVNGSGKSHLLEAINQNKVFFTDIQNPKSNTKSTKSNNREATTGDSNNREQQGTEQQQNNRGQTTFSEGIT